MSGETDKKPKSRSGAAALQFMGCVLIFLGFLNTMLTIKAAIEPDNFNTVLFIAGGILLAIGVWQGRD